jgi:hypothetical protein
MAGSIVALSSRGLGRRPLTAVARVRIPLGLPIISISHEPRKYLQGSKLVIVR